MTTTLLQDHYHLRMAQQYWRMNLADLQAVAVCYTRKNMAGNGFLVQASAEQICQAARQFRVEPAVLERLAREAVGGTPVFDPRFLEYLGALDGLKLTIAMVPDGGIYFPGEAKVRVSGPVIEVLLFEDAVLNAGVADLVATRMARLRRAARGIPIVEFGLRRAPGSEAAMLGAYAAVVAGAIGTSNVAAGVQYDLKLYGTQAHFFLQSIIGLYTGSRLTEEDAARTGYPAGTLITPTIAERIAMMLWAEQNPMDIILLTDTINSLRSGIPNAIWVFQQAQRRGWTVRGIRLDSGIMKRLVPEARAMLDAAGFTRDVAKIMVSDSVNEQRLTQYVNDHLPIDSLGIGGAFYVGDRAETGLVYKLVAIQNRDGDMVRVMKLTDDPDKGGILGDHVVRVYEACGKAAGDVIMAGEGDPFAQEIAPDKDRVFLFNPASPELESKWVKGFTARPLLELHMQDGVQVREARPVDVIASEHDRELETLWDTFRVLDGWERYPVNLSKYLYDRNNELLAQYRQDIEAERG
jgi:nicotinate phosphoribosyltransferase